MGFYRCNGRRVAGGLGRTGIGRWTAMRPVDAAGPLWLAISQTHFAHATFGSLSHGGLLPQLTGSA